MARKGYSLRFTVAPRKSILGVTSFPLDMLRYDGCFPATERASIDIGVTFDRMRREKISDIEMMQPAGASFGPTVGRWQSFGWTVTSVDGIPVIPTVG